MKTCGFRGSCAPGTSSLRCRRLFGHSLPSRRAALLGALLGAVVAGVASSLHAADTAAGTVGWRAGVTRICITPREPVWLAGYAARSGPSAGVLTDLHARALVLSAGDSRLAIVTLDLIEIPQPLHERITALAGERHGLRPEELLVNVSHTHGGPMVSATTVADWGLDAAWGARAEAYVTFLLDRIDVALGQALAGRVPVTVAHGAATCGIAMNRRLPTADGITLAPHPDGPVDHEVPVLRVVQANGSLLALLFGYACHNTALGPVPEINGDYAGFALEKLEADHPGSVALFLSGCGGDQDPHPRRDLADARAAGLALAAAVERALADEPLALAARLVVSLERCPLPFAPLPPRAELEARAASADGFVSRHARHVLETWPHPGDEPAPYPLPVQVARLGDGLVIVALGGEPMADYALRLRRELAAGAERIWVAGYSNLVHAYVPTRRVLAEGGYEGTQAVVYQGLPGPFAPDCEERIVDSVRRQAARLRGQSR